MHGLLLLINIVTAEILGSQFIDLLSGLPGDGPSSFMSSLASVSLTPFPSGIYPGLDNKIFVPLNMRELYIPCI